MSRQRKVVIALGAAGMGKSALAVKLVERYQAAGGAVRVLDPSRAFPGGLGEWSGRGQVMAWLDELTGHGEGPAGGGWGPGMVVFDDADRWLRPWIQESVIDLAVANRHLGLDVLVTGHRPQGLPKELLGNASELWLFAQEEPLALQYLAKIPALSGALADGDLELPTEPGLALRVVPRERRVELVDVFDR